VPSVPVVLDGVAGQFQQHLGKALPVSHDVNVPGRGRVVFEAEVPLGGQRPDQGRFPAGLCRQPDGDGASSSASCSLWPAHRTSQSGRYPASRVAASCRRQAEQIDGYGTGGDDLWLAEPRVRAHSAWPLRPGRAIATADM
jgi:hypothetical protein